MEEKRKNKMELHAISKARVANWNNTMEGMIAQRHRDRYKRLEDEEMERRRLDVLEFELKREERQVTLEKAYKASYAGLDNVKSLHSKMLLSDVLHEREVQMKLKEKKARMAEGIEQMWIDTENAQLDAHEEQIKNKYIQEHNSNMETATILQKQINEAKH